jgi:uncharacterized protein YbjT (DUF2867 family)
MDTKRKILVLGASGLIGRFVTDDLRARGFEVLGVARRLVASQRSGPHDREWPLMSMEPHALSYLMREHAIDVVVNCLGVLQDGPGGSTEVVHRDFVRQLLLWIRDSGRDIRLIQISIPGNADTDRTAFATTKREAERLIAASGIPHAILRPGLVVAPAAYGGSAMLRALAVLPVDLPAAERTAPLQPVAVEDVSATIAWLASRDSDEAAAVTWDVMQPQAITHGGVMSAFRYAFGTQDWPRLALPSFLLDLGCKLGDFVSLLGWMSPMRTTAMAELRRGVTGDPAEWMAATGITPKSIGQTVGSRTANIQDKWFARLYLLKPLIIASLVLFWVVSGFIALVISYDAATGILRSHNFPPALVAPITIVTSLVDMSIGLLIAFRRTCAFGLVAGMVASLGYMLGSAILTPDLWIEPLGALVKTGPAIVLMLVALATLDNR